MEVKVSAPKLERTLTVEADIPSTLPELIEKYGEPAVVAAAVANLKIGLQSYLRTMLEANQSDEKIMEAAITWVPGAKRDSATALIAKVGTLSPEERAALVKALGL